MEGILNRRVEAFLVAVRTGSISAAARELGMSQPAVSQAVRALERSTGLGLLHRTGQGVEVTEAGRLLYEAASAAQAGISRALDAAARAGASLIVGANCRTCGVVCAQTGPAFHARHPEIGLSVQDLPGNDTVAAGIEAGCELVEAALTEGRAYPSGVTFHRMIGAEVVMCVPPSDPLVSLGRPLRVDDLAGKTLCLYKRGVLDSNDLLLDEIEASGVEVNLLPCDDREYTAMNYLVNGWLTPCLSLLADRKRPMVPVHMERPQFMTIGLFSIGDPSPAARLFIEEARERFAAGGGTEGRPRT